MDGVAAAGIELLPYQPGAAMGAVVIGEDIAEPALCVDGVFLRVRQLHYDIARLMVASMPPVTFCTITSPTPW